MLKVFTTQKDSLVTGLIKQIYKQLIWGEQKNNKKHNT